MPSNALYSIDDGLTWNIFEDKTIYLNGNNKISFGGNWLDINDSYDNLFNKTFQLYHVQ